MNEGGGLRIARVGVKDYIEATQGAEPKRMSGK